MPDWNFDFEDIEGKIEDTSPNDEEIIIQQEKERREVKIPAEFAPLFQSVSRLALKIEEIQRKLQILEEEMVNQAELEDYTDELDDVRHGIIETEDKFEQLEDEIQMTLSIRDDVRKNSTRLKKLASVISQNVLVPFSLTLGGGLAILTIWLVMSGSILSLATFIITIIFGTVTWQGMKING